MMSSGAPFRKTGDLNVMESCKGEAVKLLGMTRPVWALLVGTERFRRTRVAVASRCDEPAWARELLKMFEAEPGVSFWDACDGGELCEIYKGSKKDHFRALQKKTNVAFDDMLFFDDDPARARASAFFSAFARDGTIFPRRTSATSRRSASSACSRPAASRAGAGSRGSATSPRARAGPRPSSGGCRTNRPRTRSRPRRRRASRARGTRRKSRGTTEPARPPARADVRGRRWGRGGPTAAASAERPRAVVDARASSELGRELLTWYTGAA